MAPARVAFYCHNVIGLGHIARSLKLARATTDAGARCLVVTGCRVLDRLPMPPDIELVRLPALILTSRGHYESADPSVPMHEVVHARGRQIVETCRAWSADLLVVDHSPLGLASELLPLFDAARRDRWRTRFVWGLPYAEGLDLLATPPANPRMRDAVSRYAAAIAYVPPGQEFFDRVPQWMLPSRKITAGFVSEAPLPAVSGPPGLVVVACGGGSTALELCRLAISARSLLPESARPPMRLVVGAMSDLDEVRRSVPEDDGVEWRAQGELREVIRDAAVVVSRSGYNSVALLMQTTLPMVLVPAPGGSRDQVIRAEAVAGAPGVWCVSHDDAGAAARLARALESASRAGPQSPRLIADGAARAASFFIEEAALA